MLNLFSIYEDVFASLILFLSLMILASNFALRHFLLACGLGYWMRRAVGWTGLVAVIAMLYGPASWPVEIIVSLLFLVIGIGAIRLRRQREIAISLALFALSIPIMVIP